MDRRKFLGKTSLLATIPFLGAPTARAIAEKGNPLSYDEQAEPGEIIYRTLGRTGIKVPIVSMGVMNATIPGLVVKSYEKGVRMFDTAWFYGRGMNEKMVGETIERLDIRDEVTVVTKIYLKETERDLYKPEIKDLFLQRFDESLERLKTDHVDLLLYHAASSVEEQNNPYIIEAFNELKAAGKIKHTGVSLHGDDAALLEDIAEKKFYDIAMVMFNMAYADNPRHIDALKKAADEGIGIIAMKTQCGGGGNMWWEKHEDSRATLGELNHSAMLKWVMQHEFIATAIPGYTTYDQLDENFSVASNLAYTDEEKYFMDKADVKLAQSFCIGCEKCVASCPAKADIPKLMRTYMYSYQYQNLQHAVDVAKTIPADSGLQQCNECDMCTASCKRSLNLANRIEALKELNLC